MSDQIKYCGSAFPYPTERSLDGSVNSWGENGMTLRDYFAAKALQGLLSNPRYAFEQGEQLAGVCVDVFAITDAILKAREAKP